jgi:hypothetical protein
MSVSLVARRDALSQAGECAVTVHYVENALLNSLFGLLCWDAIFAGVPGAFFHPLQQDPADLYLPNFYAARSETFERCLARLDDDSCRLAIRRTFLRAAARLRGPWRCYHLDLRSTLLVLVMLVHGETIYDRMVVNTFDRLTADVDFPSIYARGRPPLRATDVLVPLLAGCCSMCLCLNDVESS